MGLQAQGAVLSASGGSCGWAPRLAGVGPGRSGGRFEIALTLRHAADALCKEFVEAGRFTLVANGGGAEAPASHRAAGGGSALPDEAQRRENQGVVARRAAGERGAPWVYGPSTKTPPRTFLWRPPLGGDTVKFFELKFTKGIIQQYGRGVSYPNPLTPRPNPARLPYGAGVMPIPYKAVVWS
jgi:hypothetical protein